MNHRLLLGCAALAAAALLACSGDNEDGGGGSGAQAGTTGTAGTTGGGGTGAGVSSGAGGEAGTMAMPLESDFPPIKLNSGEPLPDGECKDLGAGVYGILTEIDVWWGGKIGDVSMTLDAGRGKIKVYLRMKVDEVFPDGTFEAVTRPCGARLPPFVSKTLCEAFQSEFPDEAWDKADLPEIKVLGRTTSFDPGGVIQLEPGVGLMGISLDDPLGPWPSAAETVDITCPEGTGEQCFPDHDGDGKPGMTARMRVGGMTGPDDDISCYGGEPLLYNGPPLQEDQAAVHDMVTRAEEVYLGLRTQLSGSSVIGEGCTSSTGKGRAMFLESRAWACKVLEGSGDPENPAGKDQACNAAEAAFIDENLPKYNILEEGDVPADNTLVQDPSDGTTNTVVRIGEPGDDISCAQIRDAFE